MKHFVKKFMATALVMAMAFSTVTTSHAAEITDDAVSTESVVLAEGTTVSPQSTQSTIVYKDVFMEMYYGYTGNVRVTPPNGAKLMVYLSWHDGGGTQLQFKKSTSATWQLADTINSSNGSYTHNITLVSSCDGSSYDIRFYANRDSTISYLIEAQY